MYGFDGEGVIACMHSLAGVGLAQGHLSQFVREISCSKPCFGICE
jgi:hypothetical protein